MPFVQVSCFILLTLTFLYTTSSIAEARQWSSNDARRSPPSFLYLHPWCSAGTKHTLTFLPFWKHHWQLSFGLIGRNMSESINSEQHTHTHTQFLWHIIWLVGIPEFSSRHSTDFHLPPPQSAASNSRRKCESGEFMRISSSLLSGFFKLFSSPLCYHFLSLPSLSVCQTPAISLWSNFWNDVSQLFLVFPELTLSLKAVKLKHSTDMLPLLPAYYPATLDPLSYQQNGCPAEGSPEVSEQSQTKLIERKHFKMLNSKNKCVTVWSNI